MSEPKPTIRGKSVRHVGQDALIQGAKRIVQFLSEQTKCPDMGRSVIDGFRVVLVGEFTDS